MEVLYEYTAGSGPSLVLAIICWALGTFLTIWCIATMVMDGEANGSGIFCLVFSILIGCFGFVANADTRHQEIKATINETVSWKEVNEKYELVKQEGEIYTFRVRDNAGEE